MDWLFQLTNSLNILGVALLLCIERPACLVFFGIHPSKRLSYDIGIVFIAYELILLFGLAILSWKMAMRQVQRDREARYQRISLRHP
jgi:hypothetical protein